MDSICNHECHLKRKAEKDLREKKKKKKGEREGEGREKDRERGRERRHCDQMQKWK